MPYPNRIEVLRDMASELGVSHLAAYVLGSQCFCDWSGSSQKHQHHYGRGGLQAHTFEVVDLCMANRLNIMAENPLIYIDKKELFLAALFHDFGKCWDYKPVDSDMIEWEGTPHKRLIHHISRSAVEWSIIARSHREKVALQDAVLHAILSHHGQREWGSPVAPKSRVAWLLHLCDGISARMSDAETIDIIK